MKKMTLLLTVGLGTVGLGLSGCSVGYEADEVVYSAWTEGGTIVGGEYYLIDGANGAMAYPLDTSSESWVKNVDGGSAPSISVSASEGAVAHCLISQPSTGVVLAAGTSVPGGEVRCEHSVASSSEE